MIILPYLPSKYKKQTLSCPLFGVQINKSGFLYIKYLLFLASLIFIIFCRRICVFWGKRKGGYAGAFSFGNRQRRQCPNKCERRSRRQCFIFLHAKKCRPANGNFGNHKFQRIFFNSCKFFNIWDCFKYRGLCKNRRN